LEHELDLTDLIYKDICTAIGCEAEEKSFASVRRILSDMKQTHKNACNR